jgi:pyridoxal phosphate enzyme (YggS family)
MTADGASFSERLAAVQQRIAAACGRAGRDPATVQLLAVSKKMPQSAIREAYALGLRHFGENYAQELRDKAEGLSDLRGLRWHAIGPLQTNKAKYVAKVAHAFHALDRLEIAEELSRRRTFEPLRCFLEVNLAGEASKGGVAPANVPALAEKIRALEHLTLVGLMALPPLSEDPEETRPHFRALRALAQQQGLAELSMGTSSDFEVAIEEGATVVRVGTLLFGERPPAA